MDGLPTHETHLRDHKSLRKVEGSSADFDEFALDCVCFANGSGGVLLVGIESRAVDPPADQKIGPQTLDNIRRRVGELTRNVQVNPRIATAANGGEYIIVEVPRASGVASTSDGRYRIRVGDTCQPVVGDDVLRLITDRPVVPWECSRQPEWRAINWTRRK